MNPTLELIGARASTRVYSADPVTAEQRAAILNAALRAPTAGNLSLFSIVEIEDQALKDRLAETCDDQPFIAKAPWVLIFLADLQRWIDIFRMAGATDVEGIDHRATPEAGDMILACCDALIAAQNAAIAAEALGVGSCYVGDILENGETHAELLGLPPHTFPVTMLCLGHPVATRPPTPHYTRHLVHRDRYTRSTAAELAEVLEEMQHLFAPHGLKPGFANYGQQIYAGKFCSAYQREMNRSVAWWLDRWSTPET